VPDDMSAVCRHLTTAVPPADCIALRSAVATEAATSIARWTLWLSAGSLVVSAFAVVGLLSAYRQGQHTIAVATDANRIAMENGQAQARAYIVVQSVECRLTPQGQLTTRVTFQNSGLSPARRLRWLYNAHLFVALGENEERSLTLGDEPDLMRSHWRQDIASGECWLSTPLALRRPTDPDLGAQLEQAVFLAATVKVEAAYEDVFGIMHRETACFQGRVHVGAADDPYNILERAHDEVFDQHARRIASAQGGDASNLSAGISA
jgi:hypothetical protein